jgi:hypothetical protein
MKANITIHDETEDAVTGRDLYITNLTHRAGGTTESTPATEEQPLDSDGLPLTGYDAYCFGLTHRKPAQSGKAGSNVR